MTTVFLFVLLLHIVMIAALALADFRDVAAAWQAAGWVLLGLVMLRGFFAVCRRFRPPRTTTRSGRARNADRDIWL